MNLEEEVLTSWSVLFPLKHKSQGPGPELCVFLEPCSLHLISFDHPTALLETEPQRAVQSRNLVEYAPKVAESEGMRSDSDSLRSSFRFRG